MKIVAIWGTRQGYFVRKEDCVSKESCFYDTVFPDPPQKYYAILDEGEYYILCPPDHCSEPAQVHEALKENEEYRLEPCLSEGFLDMQIKKYALKWVEAEENKE